MPKLHHRHRPLNAGELPLFVWARIAERKHGRPLPLPARRIRDRFGLSPAAAIAIAGLAGFTMEAQ